MRMPSKRRPGGTRARWGRRPAAHGPESPDSDYLLDDIQERRVYVYPYAGFSEELNERSRQTLKGPYERAVRENKFVVFVRDNEQRRLVSFSMDAE
jgi:hypothetical protein